MRFASAAIASSGRRAMRRGWSRARRFAKQFMKRHQIPTANYAVCTSSKEVEESIKHFHPPVVVKADGLAAGKGVIICPTRQFAIDAAHGLFSGELLGVAEKQVVIEEFLEGEEVSFLCLTRWHARGAAGSGAGSQADRRGRHGAEHRRHGRLLHRARCWSPR